MAALDPIIQQAFPGAEISIRVKNIPDVPGNIGAVRGKTKAQILRCKKCALSEDCTPAPYVGDTPSRYVVIGSSPHADMEPFRSKPGMLIKSLLDANGLDRSEGLFMNVVSCYTNKIQDHHITACRDNMINQLELGWTQFVLLVGTVAQKAWRPDLTLTHTHGKMYVMHDRLFVMPTYAGESALRSHETRAEIEQDIRQFARVVNGDITVMEAMDDLCARPKCREYGNQVDVDGVWYCNKHWNKGKEAAIARQVWRYAGAQGELFESMEG